MHNCLSLKSHTVLIKSWVIKHTIKLVWYVSNCTEHFVIELCSAVSLSRYSTRIPVGLQAILPEDSSRCCLPLCRNNTFRKSKRTSTVLSSILLPLWSLNVELLFEIKWYNHSFHTSELFSSIFEFFHLLRLLRIRKISGIPLGTGMFNAVSIT
jgi:hypothetical protein